MGWNVQVGLTEECYQREKGEVYFEVENELSEGGKKRP